MRLIQFITFLWAALHVSVVDSHHILKWLNSVVDVSDFECDIPGSLDKVTMPVPVSELQIHFQDLAWFGIFKDKLWRRLENVGDVTRDWQNIRMSNSPLKKV